MPRLWAGAGDGDVEALLKPWQDPLLLVIHVLGDDWLSEFVVLADGDEVGHSKSCPAVRLPHFRQPSFGRMLPCWSLRLTNKVPPFLC